jgi:hypothetical protein
MARITKHNKQVKSEKIFNLVRGSSGVTPSEISSDIDVPVRTVYNYLYEFESKGILYRDGRCWFWDYGY